MALQDVIPIPPEEKPRETGIKAIGAVPWGMHLCSFYDAKQDLVDILVPYFKAGLENNESCIWVTSEPLNEKEAEKALRKAVPDFAQYLERGQIEIIPYNEWYLKSGVFSGQRVLNAWIDKLNQALVRGYDGIRVTGNTAWLEEKDWADFTEYEEKINDVIGNYHMLVICTYSLDKCGASEVIDVVNDHPSALIRRGGDWVLIRSGSIAEILPQRALQVPLAKKRLAPLQARFLKSGFETFDDEETIELLISLCQPRKCQQLAKACIEQFDGLRGFLSASSLELQRAGLSPSCIFSVRLLHELPEEVLRQKIIEKPVYKSSEEVFDYLYYSMRDLKIEVFKVIYLNKRNEIIDTVDLFEGTLDSIPIRPREIMESAIAHNATGLIFAHNHPTGDPTPSKTDKQLTRELVFVGLVMQIKVLDHLVIGENRYFSFADEKLIEQYEDDFLNLKIKALFEAERVHG